MTQAVSAHPWKLRISQRVIFDKLVQVLVFGCAYARIAAGVIETLLALTLAAYNRMIGLVMPDVVANCCITNAPSGAHKKLVWCTERRAAVITVKL